MKAFPLSLLALGGTLLLASCRFEYRNREADLIVRNARIFSMDDAGTEHTAMAIKDGRILELGAEYQILNRYRAKKTYDAALQLIYPGFIDGHAHFLGLGLARNKVNLTGAKSWDEVLDRVTAFAETHGDGGWLLGRGWDQNLWPDRTEPVNDRLNALFPDRPVLLQRVDGHAALANQKALEMAGLTPGLRIPGGKLVERDGRLTGLLLDNAVERVEQVIGEADAAAKRLALLGAQRECLAAGLTMVCDAGLDAGTVEVLKQMEQAGELKIRLYAMLSDDTANFRAFGGGPHLGELLQVRAVKCYADGALGSRGALLLQPYSDDPAAGHGLQLSPREHFVEVARWCKEHGFQMATHCIGDSANRLILGVYGEVLGGTNDLRWRIEHAQCTDPADMPLFGRYNIIPSMQPTHATSDMLWAVDRLGPQRLANAYALKRLMRQNGMIALGTDFPVEGIDPLVTFYAAVIRKNGDGLPEGGFQMADALGREEALRGMTIWNAVATFNEEDLGSLEPGKKADFVVVDRNLLTVDEAQLLKARVQATFINGEQVWPLR
ncbi:MAG TPA: amidohydrolase [Flavobacteriales bacterium]|nr:amidohydrolase [Flavobacteriales bacterium]